MLVMLVQLCLATTAIGATVLVLVLIGWCAAHLVKQIYIIRTRILEEKARQENLLNSYRIGRDEEQN
jgi:hypothetical protein